MCLTYKSKEDGPQHCVCVMQVSEDWNHVSSAKVWNSNRTFSYEHMSGSLKSNHIILVYSFTHIACQGFGTRSSVHFVFHFEMAQEIKTHKPFKIWPQEVFLQKFVVIMMTWPLNKWTCDSWWNNTPLPKWVILYTYYSLEIV